MTTLGVLKQNWDGLAQSDPFWAICTDPSKRNQGWNQEEFFSTGRVEIDTVLQHLARGMEPDWRGAALDFGCGVGRLTQALAGRFAECVGVDIAPNMIRVAESLNRYRDTCRYVLNDSDKLAFLPANYFAFIYSSIVLQHMAPRYIVGYLREFVRVLKPGGVLVFQVPSRRLVWLGSIRNKLRLRWRLNRILSRCGLSTEDLATHIEMNCLNEEKVRRTLATDCDVVDVAITNSCDPNFNGKLRYYQTEPMSGFVSKQYVAIKHGGGVRSQHFPASSQGC